MYSSLISGGDYIGNSDENQSSAERRFLVIVKEASPNLGAVAST